MTSARSLRLSARAERDVLNVFQYSIETWGEERGEAYAKALDDALHRLVDYPEMGTTRPDLFAGAKRLPVGQHIVFYRLEPRSVRIVRVLHFRIDADRVFIRPKP